MQTIAMDSILFVDFLVEPAHCLISSKLKHMQLHSLTHRDAPLAEIAAVVSATPGTRRIAIIGQVESGALRLGNTRIDIRRWPAKNSELDLIRSILGPSGEVTLIAGSPGTGHSVSHYVDALETVLGLPDREVSANPGDSAGRNFLPAVLSQFSTASSTACSHRLTNADNEPMPLHLQGRAGFHP